VIDTVTFKDHVIVSGNDSYITMFISELRRPAMKGSAYHPIVIVHPKVPSKWEAIQGRFNDVYVVVGSLTRSMVFNKINVSEAFAVILLASGESVAAV
jgi:voltage-gated potassium channel Kch